MFVQEKIDRSSVQARQIFNKYVYETGDTKAHVQAPGYFSACRFALLDGTDTNGDGWSGGVIEARCSDGYVIGQVDGATGTFTATIPPASPLGVLQLSISDPPVKATIAVTGTGSNLVIPPTGYVPVLNQYLQVLKSGTAIDVSGFAFALINRDTLLKIDAYVDLSHSANNSTVGVVFCIIRGGVTSFSARAVHSKMPNGDDIGNIAGTGTINALAGDQIGIAVASDISGTVTIRTSSLVFQALT